MLQPSSFFKVNVATIFMQLIETNHMQTCYEDMLVEDQNHIFFQASRRQNSSN